MNRWEHFWAVEICWIAVAMNRGSWSGFTMACFGLLPMWNRFIVFNSILYITMLVLGSNFNYLALCMLFKVSQSTPRSWQQGIVQIKVIISKAKKVQFESRCLLYSNNISVALFTGSTTQICQHVWRSLGKPKKKHTPTNSRTTRNKLQLWHVMARNDPTKHIIG